MKTLIDFYHTVRKQHITSTSSGIAFFITLSVIPFFVLIISIYQILGFDFSVYFTGIINSLPKEVGQLILDFFREQSIKFTVFEFIIFIGVSFWTVSKVFIELNRFADKVFHQQKIRTRFKNRIISIYTLGTFILLLIVIYLLMNIKDLVLDYFREISTTDLTERRGPIIILLNYLVPFVIQITFLSILFQFITPVKLRIRSLLVSSIFVIIGWFLTVKVFSFYVSNLSNYSVLYGAFSFIIIAIYWIYLLASIILIGIVINYYDYQFLSRK